MKTVNSHSAFRTPHSTLRRLLALTVAETFLATSFLPAWALPTDHLRPKIAAERVFAAQKKAADGGNRQHWSQERIITTIQALHELGEELNYSTVQKKYPKLVQAAHTHFPPPGSWKAAMTAAGLEYQEIQRRKPFSREEELRREKERKRERGEVVSEIRMLWAQGVLPYTAWIHAHYPALYNKGKRSFGKWSLALEAAGIPKELRQFQEGQAASSRRFSKSKSTIDAILKEFHKVDADLGIRNIMANHQAFLIATLEFYPTWTAAVKKNTGLEIQFPSLPEVTHEWIEKVAAKGRKARDGGEEKGPQDDTVISARAPEPVGAYPHARWVGDRLYLSGIGPRKRGSKDVPGATVDAAGNLIDYDIEAEIRSAMENVRLVLEEAGARWEYIYKVRVYLTEKERDWATYSRVYKEYFPPGPNQPVRTTIEVKSLPQGGNTPIHFEVEVTATKARDGGEAQLAEAERQIRRPIIGGNWKMAIRTEQDARKLLKDIANQLAGIEKMDVVVTPSFAHLATVRNTLRRLKLPEGRVFLGAQNISEQDPGAWTGETSWAQLEDLGVSYIIIGHSERRILGETDRLINAKAKKALEHGFKIILGVGETLDEREAGRTFEVIERQLRVDLEGVSSEQMANVVIAYEPVWAIGTGRNATPDQADKVQGFIRDLLLEIFDYEIAAATRIQYGGSVKAGNIADLIQKPNIDGALIGGVSLKADEFVQILRTVEAYARARDGGRRALVVIGNETGAMAPEAVNLVEALSYRWDFKDVQVVGNLAFAASHLSAEQFDLLVVADRFPDHYPGEAEEGNGALLLERFPNVEHTILITSTPDSLRDISRDKPTHVLPENWNDGDIDRVMGEMGFGNETVNDGGDKIAINLRVGQGVPVGRNLFLSATDISKKGVMLRLEREGVTLASISLSWQATWDSSREGLRMKEGDGREHFFAISAALRHRGKGREVRLVIWKEEARDGGTASDGSDRENAQQIGALVSKANRLRQQDRFKEAERILLEARRVSPRLVINLAAMNAQATLYRKWGKREEAFSVLNEAISKIPEWRRTVVSPLALALLDDQSLTTYAELAGLYFEMGQYAVAFRMAQMGLRLFDQIKEPQTLSEHYSPLLHISAKALRKMGKVDDAIDLLQKAAKQSPEMLQNGIYVFLSEMLRQRGKPGDPEEADRIFESAIQAAEKEALSRYDREQWRKARDLFTWLTRHRPDLKPRGRSLADWRAELAAYDAYETGDSGRARDGGDEMGLEAGYPIVEEIDDQTVRIVLWRGEALYHQAPPALALAYRINDLLFRNAKLIKGERRFPKVQGDKVEWVEILPDRGETISVRADVKWGPGEVREEEVPATVKEPARIQRIETVKTVREVAVIYRGTKAQEAARGAVALAKSLQEETAAPTKEELIEVAKARARLSVDAEGVATLSFQTSYLGISDFEGMTQGLKALRERISEGQVTMLVLDENSIGADIKDHSIDAGTPLIDAMTAFLYELMTLPVPKGTVVRKGFLLGGGLEIALATDLIVGADYQGSESPTLLGFPEPQLAVYKLYAAILLPRLAQAERAVEVMEWLMGGNYHTLKEAEKLGIVELTEGNTKAHLISRLKQMAAAGYIPRVLQKFGSTVSFEPFRVAGEALIEQNRTKGIARVKPYKTDSPLHRLPEPTLQLALVGVKLGLGNPELERVLTETIELYLQTQMRDHFDLPSVPRSELAAVEQAVAERGVALSVDAGRGLHYAEANPGKFIIDWNAPAASDGGASEWEVGTTREFTLQVGKTPPYEQISSVIGVRFDPFFEKKGSAWTDRAVPLDFGVPEGMSVFHLGEYNKHLDQRSWRRRAHGRRLVSVDRYLASGGLLVLDEGSYLVALAESSPRGGHIRLKVTKWLQHAEIPDEVIPDEKIRTAPRPGQFAEIEALFLDYNREVQRSSGLGRSVGPYIKIFYGGSAGDDTIRIRPEGRTSAMLDMLVGRDVSEESWIQQILTLPSGSIPSRLIADFEQLARRKGIEVPTSSRDGGEAATVALSQEVAAPLLNRIVPSEALLFRSP